MIRLPTYILIQVFLFSSASLQLVLRVSGLFAASLKGPHSRLSQTCSGFSFSFDAIMALSPVVLLTSYPFQDENLLALS